MRHGRPILLLLLAAAWWSAPARGADAPASHSPVKLAVLVVFDQMRGDYLTRWDDLFGDDGFHRLEKGGAWFQNCNYPYSSTVTGAGHASLATGCSPDKHGVVANEWYDRVEGATVYCATSLRSQRVPSDKDSAADGKQPKGGTPERLLSPTLADALKEQTKGKAKVVALSFKDRGAVFFGGKQPDACYWLESETGRAVTSSYYRDGLPPWVQAFNDAGLADQWFGKQWTRLRDDLDYEKYSGPDDAPGEDKGFAQGRTFPHPLDGGLQAPGKNYYEALYNSPFGNEVLLDLAERAVKEEKLGTGDATDLLCVSFSCNDTVGHCWGPDSQEVLDVTLRSDRLIARLLRSLDAAVGEGRYLLVVTADHGVCPLPEESIRRGREARRILPSLLQKQAEAFLHETFGAKDEGGQALEAFVNENIYLNRAWVKAHDLDSAKVEEALAKWLAEQPGILKAYSQSQLLKGPAKDDEIGARVKRSFHPDRSGDVVLVLKPYWLLTSRLSGTTHGSPHAYDTLVPLIVYGPGVRPGVRRDAAIPQAAVPVLAHALGVRPPADAEAPVPDGLFGPASP